MQVEIKIAPDCREPKIIIMTARVTDEISTLVQKLSESSPQILSGWKDDFWEVLEPSDIYRIYASNGKVYAQTDAGKYSLRLRLYELDEWLDRNQFVRISNSEIINIRKVRNFDLSFAGTICVCLTNGTVTYVSRRYVSKLKQILGL